MQHEDKASTYLITVKGLVQGVGFRPFVYRMARNHGLSGLVQNTNENVRITLNATPRQLEAFLNSFRKELPPAAELHSLSVSETDFEAFDSFLIGPSEDRSDRITQVSPDIAVCGDCLKDMKRQPHRLDYPFINCTNCGPRFTIISGLPYDRQQTTMKEFSMCDRCRSEYEDAGDRRFHAQPVACRDCGPSYELLVDGCRSGDLGLIPRECARMIDRGGIIAVKGMGGFHLACDALNEEAVSRLRASKKRERKPFAVMFRDLDALQGYTPVGEKETGIISSWRRPILILPCKIPLAADVSVGFHTVGAMLPYMPFHYLLFEYLRTPVIVLTSGNISDEPVIISNAEAEKKLKPLCDALLTYNRDIRNRADDSVVSVIGGETRVIRRSRGYVPGPIRVDLDVDGIFAAGAELVNCFGVGKADMAMLSQHIGDLKNFPTYAFYRESVGRFLSLFRVSPELVVHDMHPDYLSTRYARELDAEHLAVQHHHAHIVSVMAEHRLQGKVIGVSFDGTGYGTDGNTWGGEFLVCDRADFKRYAHFRYMPMPGGDAVTREPWRAALSWLHAVYGKDLLRLSLPFMKRIPTRQIGPVLEMIEKGFNAPLSSSAGRLFDAVSALLNICTSSGFHAEAPMRLENAADPGEKAAYEVVPGPVIDFAPMFRDMVDDINGGTDPGRISARFHNSLVILIREMAGLIRDATGIRTVVLSGGTFQNRILLEGALETLGKAGLQAYTNSAVPANDGGIALGQLIIAAARR